MQIANIPYNIDNMKSPAVTLLIQHYLDWQKDLGEVKSMKEFAQHIDMPEASLNRVINGKTPVSKSMLVHFAKKLKDPRFYALENLPEPDLNFERLMKVWQYIPIEKRRELREQGEKYVKEIKKKEP